MNNLKEQWFAVKFCVKLGNSTTETFTLLNTAYGDVAMKRATCFRWHKRFKDGRLSVEDDERFGRPSTSTDDPQIDEINTLVRANRRLTVRELAEECGISLSSGHHILMEELKMHCVAAKFVPRLMTSDQQAHRVQVCQDLLDHSENDKELLSKIITGDESWVYGYDAETKVQSSQWMSKTSPRPKKACQVRSKIKVLLTVFLMLVELSATSTFLKAPQWTRPTTLKFWNVWGMLSDRKGQNCGGVVSGFSIMTTLQPIQPSELVSFWPNIPSLFFPTPLLTWPCSMWFLFVPHAQKTFERKKIWDHSRD